MLLTKIFVNPCYSSENGILALYRKRVFDLAKSLEYGSWNPNMDQKLHNSSLGFWNIGMLKLATAIELIESKPSCLLLHICYFALILGLEIVSVLSEQLELESGAICEHLAL